MKPATQLELFQENLRRMNLIEIKNMLELPRCLLREYSCTVEEAINLYRKKFNEKPARIYVMGARVFIPYPGT